MCSGLELVLLTPNFFFGENAGILYGRKKLKVKEFSVEPLRLFCQRYGQ